MRKESKLLKQKAIASLRRAAQAFNSLDDDGRITTVLLHTQHAFEMLLKAALREKQVVVFDKRTGRSIGFDKCVNLATEKLKLSSAAAGTLRALDALRDDEQHYLGCDDEGLLYVHLRAGVTLFDDILRQVFSEGLSDHLPDRVLPISTQPPADLDLLIDQEFSQIRELLKPSRRKRAEARKKIRTLLAMEAHTTEEVSISEKDVDRVEKAVRAGKDRGDVFPRLAGLTTVVEGTGLSVTVRFSKKEGIPVRYIAADDPTEAAAVREVDLQRKYYLSRADLAKKLGLTPEKAAALRWHLGIDTDPDCQHTFVHGASRFPSFSDNAVGRMKAFLDGGIDLDEVVGKYRAARRAGDA
ncbi:MAG: DUF3644 domain-containing protein [Hyphomicrobiales bacterium]